MRKPRRKVVLGAALLLLVGLWLAEDVGRPPAEQLSARAGVALIRFYRQELHPYTSGHTRCRLHPTCSGFGMEALRQEGFAGVLSIGERLVQCSRAPALPRQSDALMPRGLASHRPAVSLAFWQRPRSPEEDAAAGAGCAACLASTLFMVLFVVGLFASWIALLVFVVRDAKNRGTENPVLWLILIFFTHIIGLVIYFLARPAGNLVACEHCKNKKLQYARACPHCGNVDARAAAPPGGSPPAPPAAGDSSAG
jgi:putative component of membrane protein insertase Oxa1/YidC/SpoIIIJ protein YidD